MVIIHSFFRSLAKLPCKMVPTFIATTTSKLFLKLCWCCSDRQLVKLGKKSCWIARKIPKSFAMTNPKIAEVRTVVARISHIRISSPSLLSVPFWSWTCSSLSSWTTSTTWPEIGLFWWDNFCEWFLMNAYGFMTIKRFIPRDLITWTSLCACGANTIRMPKAASNTSTLSLCSERFRLLLVLESFALIEWLARYCLVNYDFFFTFYYLRFQTSKVEIIVSTNTIEFKHSQALSFVQLQY